MSQAVGVVNEYGVADAEVRVRITSNTRNVFCAQNVGV